MNGKSTEVGRKFVAYGDVLRMIASAMAVMLHCISPYVKSTAFYGARSWVLFVALDATCRAGVPLFLMLSGAMLLSRDETEGTLAFYRRKITPVLVLIVFWDIFYYLYDFLFFYGQENFSLRELIDRMLNNGTEYHIWYLYTLVGIYLTAPFLKKALARCSECETVILLIITAFCSTLRPFFNTVLPVYLYLFDPLANGYLGFFLLGYILSRRKFHVGARCAFYACGVLGAGLCVYSTVVASGADGLSFPFNYGYSIVHYASASAIFVLVRALFDKKGSDRVSPAPLRRLSGATLGIYLLHVVTLAVVQSYLPVGSLTPLPAVAALFAVTYTVSLVLSLVLSRIPFIGKYIV